MSKEQKAATAALELYNYCSEVRFGRVRQL